MVPKSDATRTAVKMSAIRDHTMLLWELYAVLLETRFARAETLRTLRDRPRGVVRPMNREATNAILISEAYRAGRSDERHTHRGPSDTYAHKRRSEVSHTREEPPPGEKRRRVNDEMELEEIRIKLKSMRQRRPRLCRDETLPVRDRNKNFVLYPFCGATGKHIADRCP